MQHRENLIGAAGKSVVLGINVRCDHRHPEVAVPHRVITVAQLEIMQKLNEVEAAKALMNEAMGWSVMKWLREKKTVRKAADVANAALDRLSEALKAQWNESIRAAYDALGSSNGKAKTMDRQAGIIAKKVKDADDEARRARQDAEETFDKAERLMSTSLAREGCRKAILSWELHEKAIRQAETALGAKANLP